MGRRSINTTKSGKFMNPTDQARKEARKKELKRNKRQRNIVRAAVLKGKDPHQILDEMELVDKMEFDPTQPPRLNERVLKEKHRKLKEMFDRVLNMYDKEDAEYAMELRRMQASYEKKRQQMQVYFDQVKNAERVKLEQIPLPEAPGIQAIASMILLPGDIPLPSFSHGRLSGAPLHGILKKSGGIPPGAKSRLGGGMMYGGLRKRKPVGPPPGTPPDLSDSDDEIPCKRAATGLEEEGTEYNTQDKIDEKKKRRNSQSDDSDFSDDDDDDDDDDDSESDDDNDDKSAPSKQKKIRFMDDGSRPADEDEKDTRLKFKPSAAALQAKVASRPVSESEKSDTKHKQKRAGEEKREDSSSSSSDDSDVSEPSDDDDDALEKISKEEKAAKRRAMMEKQSSISAHVPPMGLPPGPPPGLPPMMYRQQGPPGPPPRMLPPGPPRGRPPMMMSGPGGPPLRGPPPMRLPPGPPGMPPPHLIHNIPPPGMPVSMIPPPRMGGPPNILSAPPTIMRTQGGGGDGVGERKGATIEAKAQIKHVIGDSTRFLPTALRVKREAKGKQAVNAAPHIGPVRQDDMKTKPSNAAAAAVQTKDDAYDSFMKEMEGLL